jgi:hypothetical protein
LKGKGETVLSFVIPAQARIHLVDLDELSRGTSRGRRLRGTDKQEAASPDYFILLCGLRGLLVPGFCGISCDPLRDVPILVTREMWPV